MIFMNHQSIKLLKFFLIVKGQVSQFDFRQKRYSIPSMFIFFNFQMEVVTLKVESPWQIQSIYELLYFNCPSCPYKNNSKQSFICHAFDAHQESVDFLRNISDGSLSNILCPWDSNNHESNDNITESIEKPSHYLVKLEDEKNYELNNIGKI